MKTENLSINKFVILPCLIILFLFKNSSVLSQANSKIKIIDNQSNKGIPYAYVYKKNQPIGYSDSLGYFTENLLSSAVGTDSVFFSSVGYTKIGYPISYLAANKYIIMQAKVDTLQEIIVRKIIRKDSLIIGPNRRIISSVEFCNSSSWGMIFANYFTFPNALKSVTITQIEVFISQKGSSPIRLRVLDKNKNMKNLLPGDDITPISILLKPYKKGWNTFVLNKPVIVPLNQFFIGIEIIKDQNTSKNDKQCIGFTKSDLISFFGYDTLARWTNTKVILNSESPMIRTHVIID